MSRKLALSSLVLASASCAAVVVSASAGASVDVPTAASTAARVNATHLFPAATAPSESADSRAVAGVAGLSNARLLTQRGVRQIYTGRQGEAGYCLAVKNAESGRVTATCAGADIVAAGRLHLTIGGDAEGSLVTAGLPPTGTASVTVFTADGDSTVARVRDGAYVMQTATPPVKIASATDPARVIDVMGSSPV